MSTSNPILPLRRPSTDVAPATTVGREPALDSLRGLAALAVVFAHLAVAGLSSSEPLWSTLKWTPLRIFWSGHQAVILFFVLSGFALTRMLHSIPSSRYDAYILSRIARIYPPYLASIIVAFCAYAALQKFIPWNAGWMSIPKPALGSVSILDHIMMVGVFNTSEINPPIWSIVYEMRISMVFPLIYVAVKHLRAKSIAIFIVMSLCISWLTAGYISLTETQTSFLISLHYTTFFAIGSYIAFDQAAIVRLFSRNRAVRSVLWLAALVLYAYPFNVRWSISERMIGDLGIGVGAFMIIALILSAKNETFLHRIRFLGRISYSLYLNHILAVNIAILLLYDSAGPLAVWVVGLPAAILFSSLVYFLVERPSISISRQLRRITLQLKSRTLSSRPISDEVNRP